MPITIIREWAVSIRPCEFDNFARLLGIATKVQTNSPEYRYVMGRLTSQASNQGEATTWRASTYKVGDPILFNETGRFRPVIYNNLKGRIVCITPERDRVQFDVQLDRTISEFDVHGTELEWMGNNTVRFAVYNYDVSDDDDDSLNTTVPFQVAYAVSIHKAQGLEYDSVKIVITDANENDISHSIFYTAVTRARERLRIFWAPETQQAVLKGLRRSTNPKDAAILSSRRGLAPVAGLGANAHR